MKYNLLALLVLCLLASSCGKSDDSANKTDGLSSNPITSKSWCSVTNMAEHFQAVSRFTFQSGGQNKIILSYLRVSDTGSPIVYQIDKSYDWELKGSQASVSYSTFTVELLESKDNIDGLNATRQQRAIFDQLLKNNPQLKVAETTFNPKTALSLKHRSMMASKESEQILYPCETYSSEFNAQSPVRPILEFDILVGQSIWQAGPNVPEFGLANRMLLKFPLEQMDTSTIAVPGSSWCAWSQLSAGDFMVDTVTFSNAQFARNEYTESWFTNDMSSVLKDDVMKSPIYSIAEKGLYLSGEADGQSMKLNKMFAAMKDSDGTEFLVKMNPYHPEATEVLLFGSLYFKCDDPRPLGMLRAETKKNLPKLLKLQSSRL